MHYTQQSTHTCITYIKSIVWYWIINSKNCFQCSSSPTNILATPVSIYSWWAIWAFQRNRSWCVLLTGHTAPMNCHIQSVFSDSQLHSTTSRMCLYLWHSQTTLFFFCMPGKSIPLKMLGFLASYLLKPLLILVKDCSTWVLLSMPGTFYNSPKTFSHEN